MNTATAQPSLFEDIPTPPAKIFRTTVVRSHDRRVPGDPDIAESAKPQAAMMPPATPTPKPTDTPKPITTPRAPHNGSRTSRAAAEGVSEGRKVSQAELCFGAVLRAMASSPMGLTRQDLAAALNIKEGIICARVRPMVTGEDTRFSLVEPGLTRIGLEGARQKVLWVAIERQEPIVCFCGECGGEGVSRLFEVGRPGMDDPSKPVYRGYLTVRSCRVSGCWWSEVA